ncbi:MAG: hypothetical protein OEY75_06715 [Hylemonella sp.]|nr:hypothetical protein [Hylemonella sp.]
MTELPDIMSESNKLHQEQQEWAAALARLEGQPLEAYQFRFSLLRLVSWPGLTHLPDEHIPAVARICALLARKPTAASLIPLTLGMSEEQAFALIEVLRQNQNIEAVGGIGATASVNAQDEAPELQAGDKPRESSLIGKLWQRLGIRP